MNPETLKNIFVLMLGGAWNTLKIFFLTLLFSLPLGLAVTFLRSSKFKPISWLTKFYLLVMRGTPLILQIIFFYFAPYYLFHFTYDRFAAIIVAFTLNYAAYFAEIYRGGIESIPLGQYEAATALGFTKGQTFFKIILPQVVKRILPPSCNEFMTLVKDTSLAQIIAVGELFRIANDASSRYFSTVPLLMAGVFYFVMNLAVSQCFNAAEKKLDYYK